MPSFPEEQEEGVFELEIEKEHDPVKFVTQLVTSLKSVSVTSPAAYEAAVKKLIAQKAVAIQPANDSFLGEVFNYARQNFANHKLLHNVLYEIVKQLKGKLSAKNWLLAMNSGLIAKRNSVQSQKPKHPISSTAKLVAPLAIRTAQVAPKPAQPKVITAQATAEIKLNDEIATIKLEKNKFAGIIEYNIAGANEYLTAQTTLVNNPLTFGEKCRLVIGEPTNFFTKFISWLCDCDDVPTLAECEKKKLRFDDAKLKIESQKVHVDALQIHFPSNNSAQFVCNKKYVDDCNKKCEDVIKDCDNRINKLKQNIQDFHNPQPQQDNSAPSSNLAARPAQGLAAVTVLCHNAESQNSFRASPV